MHRANWLLWWEQGKPYLFLSLNELCLAILMILVEDLFSDGINSFVFVVYEHAISTILLSLLAFFLERRPPLSFKIICYAFLLGLLQVTLCQMLMTVALQFISSTYESVAINLVPSIVFVLALAFGLEKLSFPTINGQAKVWGLAFSAAGAITVVLWKGPQIFKLSFSKALQATSNGGSGIIGSIMIVIGILATCFWNITVDHVVKIYPAELSLTAMMSFFGTIQTAIVAAFLASNSSWKLKWEKGLTLSTLLLGGTVVTGLSYYVMAWSIKKKGPVFTTAFNPLLVVFSFLLQTFVLGSSVHLGSVVGAVFVMIGLYLLLWAKANDVEKNVTSVDATLHSPLIQP